MGIVRVLIIDDDADCADSLHDLLNVLGYEVAVAYGGAAGLELARRFSPRVVLTDLAMPDVNGYQFAAAIRSDPQFQSVRLIAVSGHALQEDVSRAAGAGFVAHLAKPVELDRLVRLLEEGAKR